MYLKRCLLLFLIIACLLNACLPDLIQNEVPELDEYQIVFQKLKSNSRVLTFYNIEMNEIFDLAFTQEVSRPIVSRSDKVIPLLRTSNNFSGIVDLETGRLKKCGGWPNSWIADDSRGDSPYDIILATPSTVYRYDLKDCEIKEVLIDFDNHRDTLKYDGGLMGFSMTPDGKQLYFGKERWSGMGLPTKYTLYMFQIAEKELSEIGEGISPSVSNGGNLLAYFSYNGLYLLDLTTKITEKLLDFPEPDSVFPPQIYWSSDDTKLLFHFEPERKEGSLFNNLEMIVFDLEKMEKTTLPIKGLYPSWIH